MPVTKKKKGQSKKKPAAKTKKKKTKASRNGPKYPDIKVRLSGIDSNAFSIMGAVAKGLRNGGVSHKEIEKFREESMSGDHDHLIQTAMKWVETS